MKKAVSLILSVIMLISVIPAFPLSASASGEGSLDAVENPVYCDSSVSSKSRTLNANYMLSNAEYLRDEMVDRSNNIQLEFTSPNVLSKTALMSQMNELFMSATSDELSVSAVDGDYIRWQWEEYSASYVYRQNSSGSYDYELDMTVYYYDTAKEEQQVDEVIDEYLSSLNLTSYSDYELLKEFHDFVLDSCDYDYAYNSRRDKYDFSIYGALVKGRAVCQGYALAFYRLCKEAGISVRFISSDPDEGCHAWNLVYIGDAYYYVDCTWDDELDDKYELFLVNYDNIQSLDRNYEHKPYDQYYGDSVFESRYGSKISPVDWDENSSSLANCTVSLNYSNGVTVCVKDKAGNTLKSGTDYTVSIANANYAAVVTGKGAYTGSTVKRKRFINGLTPLLEYKSVKYTNEEKCPTVTLSGLKNGVDYTVYYSDNKQAGTAGVYLRAQGKYCGFTKTSFTILKAAISSFNIKLEYTSAYYDGFEKCPSVTIEKLEQGQDYSLTYYSNTDPGTAYVEITGINNCSSTVKKSFKISKYSIKEKKITLSKTTYTYNGYAKKPQVKISGLVEGEDYKVSYSSNKNPGIAKVTITGMGYFTGTVTKTFKIKPTAVDSLKLSSSTSTSVKLKWNKCKGVSGYVIERYSSNKWKTVKTVSSDKNSVELKNLSPATTYKYRVRAYKKSGDTTIYGDYSTTLTVSTKPQKVSIKSPSSAKNSITVKWKSIKSSGYQIEYSTNADFKNSKKKTVSGSSKTLCKITSLKKGKKYYVRVRAYKTVNGKKVYGAWSAKKSITCK